MPIEALIHEDDDTFVMVAGDDKKAHKRKVEVGLTTPTTAELVGGVKAGEQVIVQGQQGLPDGGRHRHLDMTLSALVERHGRAILTVTAVLAAAGLMTGLLAAERHLSAAGLSAHRRRSATAARCRRGR